MIQDYAQIGIISSGEDGCVTQLKLRRAEAEADQLSYNGKLRAPTANSCIQLSRDVCSRLQEIFTPFLCCIGTKDCVVNNSGAADLIRNAKTIDRMLKE